MTADEMLALKEPVGAEAVPGLENVRILSGKLMHGDRETLTCSVLMVPEFVTKKRMWTGPMSGWEWKVARPATLAEIRRLPSWDGIVDGMPVTRGHVAALREGGWLPEVKNGK
jgi:hypothetical protein